jgi:ATP-binding cassette subfamily A (ABC1) protein 5
MGYYGNQLKALIKRNLLLKKYTPQLTFIEIFLPILMAFISYIVNNVSQTKVYSAADPTDTFDINYAFNLDALKNTYSSTTPTIGYILPGNNQDETIINKIKSNEIFQKSPVQFVQFNHQNEMNEFNNNYHNLLIAGIIFESEDYLHYTLRVNSTAAPDPSGESMMNYALGRYQSEEHGRTDADLYISTFSPLQAAIDESILQIRTKDDQLKMQHYIGKLGKAACNRRNTNNGGNLAYYISIIYMIPIIVIVVNLVKEKEEGIKDGLLMAGVHPTIFWLSWLVIYIFFSCIISVFVTGIFYFTKTFANVQVVITFLALFFYGLCCCSQAFIFSTLFKKNKTAGATVSIVIVALSCSNMITPFLNIIVRKILSPFLCQIAIGSLVYEIDDMENKFINLTFRKLLHSDAGYFFFALILNNVLCFLLAIIFDNLFSSEEGRYLSLFYKRGKSHLMENSEISYEQDIQEDFHAQKGEKCRVEVNHVHKIFPRKKDKSLKDNESTSSSSSSSDDEKSFLAVNDISFKVYENEIFSILGHNGAGKTTLINIMVGLLKASQGEVYFDERSISKNTNRIRKDFGVCAQYNTIFENLSVEEHIRFYAELKNIKVDVDEVLKDIDLLHQKEMKAVKLSGGQKRKLCIGMALIGNPKYVFLDEPTTGLDPLSRRKIWELLLKKKMGRVIFLTTHYMDEADILADRKLILSKGKIRCLGTSLYLKNHFNMSYDLDIETNQRNQIQSIIHHYIPEATYVYSQNQNQNLENEGQNQNQNQNNQDKVEYFNNNIDNNNNNNNNNNKSFSMEGNDVEIQCHTWKLPINTTDKFPPLLNKLDELMEEADKHPEYQGGLVKKYALNMPTLEELFVHLEDHVYDDDTRIHKNSSCNFDNVYNSKTSMDITNSKPNNSNNNYHHSTNGLLRPRLKITPTDSTTTPESTNDIAIDITNNNGLPELKSVSPPSNLHLIGYLIRSRLKIFVKDKGFAFFAIIFPAIINGVMFFITQRVFMKKSSSSKSGIISIPSMYSHANFNMEPKAQLPFTEEDVITAMGGGANRQFLTHLPLNMIPNPRREDPYYLSSFGGREVTPHHFRFDIHYNDTMIHAIPATINALSNAILASKNVSDRIVITSHLYDTTGWDVNTMVGLTISGFMIGYCIVANINRFGPLIVRERELQLLKQLQLNGVSRKNYWISCFLTDVLLFLFSCILIFLVGIVVQFEPLLDFKILALILLLLIVWSVPTMLFQYVTSFLFDKEESAFSAMPLINTFPVIFGYLIFMLIGMNYNIFDGIMKGKGVIGPVANLYNIILSAITPAYGFVAMVNSIFTMKAYEKLMNYDLTFHHLIQFSNGISPILLVLVVVAFVHFYLLIQLDIKKNQTNKKDIHEMPEELLSQRLKELEEGDEDVRKEYYYVKDHQQDLPLSVLHLSKEYRATLPTDKEKKKEIMNRDPLHYKFGEIHKSLIPTTTTTNKYVKTAVVEVNFGVRNHECFGLLGPNGAGKSTTLNTITATIPQTTGTICFHGIQSHIARLGEISMGYCPQNDILWKELTLREHLELFLRIRGYTAQESKAYATQYIQILGLEEHQHKRAEDLSGGTKRKLSLLIAICGYPQQILLDEPSAGMDPSTRRLVWDTIKKTKNRNDSAIIMTTHSMEEAENLCDRLAILINGRLSCIGSPEHLKMKFGDSYILELQSSNLEQFHKEVVERRSADGGDPLFDGHDYEMEKSSMDRVKYKVKMTHHLGYVFEVMEDCKRRGLVSDYSFNQTTLEQIFINFAKQQVINPE